MQFDEMGNLSGKTLMLLPGTCCDWQTNFGTVIATGTPGGVGMGFNPPKFLQPGDTIKCSIENIGDLINKVNIK